ncbi:MAG: NosD domain-containing protein [Candidatus Heimdallarchaeaceae archaeon]
MKTINKKLILSVTLLSSGLVVGLLTFYFGYSPSSYIRIESDDDWARYIKKGLIYGEGTPENPYIIENLKITDYRFAISIRFVSSCFEIRNCQISATVDAVFLVQITSNYYKISNCTLHGGFHAIRTASGNNITVQRNNLSSSSHYTLSLSNINNTLIIDNIIKAQGEGIFLYGVSKGLISNNAININHTSAGGQVRIYSCSSLNITKNIFNTRYNYNSNPDLILFNCSRIRIFNSSFSVNSGIYFDECKDVQIVFTRFTNCLNAIHAYNSSNVLISYCLFQDNIYGAVFFDKISYSYVHHNSFLDNLKVNDSNGSDNCWFDESTNEGNYWINYIVNPLGYEIPGSTDSVDPYPLSVPPV